jgi:hypothetical protein
MARLGSHAVGDGWRGVCGLADVPMIEDDEVSC